ncbi:hypothetical protein GGF38_001353 [Coemansia sp. RSA 25]|nr:hypothetical protein GGF38_001353 [Coemansia sp. RSA 25]
MLWIDGKALDEGQCIRPYHDKRNYPVKDPQDKDMVCRTPDMSGKDVALCDVKAGANITVEWHESDPKDRAISGSHLGPCLVYLAPLESNGEGSVWIKIFEEGYDPSTKKWCVDKIIKSKGKLDITIPDNISPGKYLMRTEVIALHGANKPYGDGDNGAEYFPNCAHINIIGDAPAVAPKLNMYAIPGIYNKDDEGILFNLYKSYKSYSIPGPSLYMKDNNIVNNPTVPEPGSNEGGGDDEPAPVYEPEPPAPTGRKPCLKKKKRRRMMKRN